MGSRMIERAQSYHLKDLVRLAHEYYQLSPYKDIPFDSDAALDFGRRQMVMATSFFPVYTVGNSVEGFAIAYMIQLNFSRSLRVNLEYIYVREQYRSQGAAEQLVQAVESWARQVGAIDLVTGDIGINPELMRRWYSGQGYQYEGVCMTKRLN